MSAESASPPCAANGSAWPYRLPGQWARDAVCQGHERPHTPPTAARRRLHSHSSVTRWPPTQGVSAGFFQSAGAFQSAGRGTGDT